MSTKINLERYRGDTIPEQFTLTTSAGPVDITGWSFSWSVDTLQSPATPSVTNQFTIAGVVTDAVNGVFEFRPSLSDINVTGRMYHEVTATDSSGYIETVIVGKITFTQDLA